MLAWKDLVGPESVSTGTSSGPQIFKYLKPQGPLGYPLCWVPHALGAALLCIHVDI